MPRITIKMQVQEIMDSLKNIGTEFIRKTYPNGYPVNIYELISYKIRKLDVFNVYYRWPMLPYFNIKHPKGGDLLTLKNYVASLDLTKMESENIIFEYEYFMQGFSLDDKLSRVTGAHWLKDITGEKISFDSETLKPLQEINRQKYEPREGHEPCKYCGVQTPTDKLIPANIIFQDSRWNGYKNVKFVNKKSYLFCSKQCAENEQMSREG